MRKILRNLLPYLIGSIISIAILFLGINPRDIENFSNLLEANISMGSISIGFLVATITMMSTLETNSFIRKLKDLRAYEKLLDLFLQTLKYIFISCLFSLIGLFFPLSKDIDVNVYFFAAWAFVFVISIYFLIFVIFYCIKIFRISMKDQIKWKTIEPPFKRSRIILLLFLAWKLRCEYEI